jgi:hypothetical protein
VSYRKFSLSFRFGQSGTMSLRHFGFAGATNRLRERTSSLHGNRTQADLSHGEEDARLAGCVFELPKITMDTIQTEQPRKYKKR